jgi:NAD-dependent dihydropyrimidine dehydrogenase PreA subunit
MPPEIDRETCIGCQACVQACPNNALEMDNEEKSVLAHPEKCTDVWACVDVCPTGACRKSAKKEAAKKEPAKKPVGKPAKK